MIEEAEERHQEVVAEVASVEEAAVAEEDHQEEEEAEDVVELEAAEVVVEAVKVELESVLALRFLFNLTRDSKECSF